MSGAHLAMLALAFAGFGALALATERHAKHLLRVLPALRWRRTARIGGWLLLGGALLLGMRALDTAGVGIAIWCGWLSIAAILLVFALPEWPWQPPVKARSERAPKGAPSAMDDAPMRKPRRWIGWLMLGSTMGTFALAYARVETRALDRDDAIHGQVGPWGFTFAEADRNAPEVASMDIPIKAYRLRFCEMCDASILHVYLKVNKPRAMRAAGVAFEGNRWDRGAEIQLPSNLTGDSQLWMTVIGKDGTVHQVAWPMKAISPATVDWFAEQAKGE
ncbi:DUF3325 domain-containing protein [Sphingobium sp. WCS2017Hpa-17]|uniref:DUF3325 domain-containing protein n=1 Tax=Sphingobium sp. WCS2017Hpa-17 TaxID=3073638 RepID=UPI00288B8C82|nr:DUF3325 domain-containing protein [Sphingobium sp. WCS2017Hpa-17]